MGLWPGTNELRCRTTLDDPSWSGAIVGGDSGGCLFRLNPATQKMELIAVHQGAQNIDGNPHVYQNSIHASAFGRADWIRARLTPGNVSPLPSTPSWPPQPVSLSVERLIAA